MVAVAPSIRVVYLDPTTKTPAEQSLEQALEIYDKDPTLDSFISEVPESVQLILSRKNISHLDLTTAIDVRWDLKNFYRTYMTSFLKLEKEDPETMSVLRDNWVRDTTIFKHLLKSLEYFIQQMNMRMHLNYARFVVKCKYCALARDLTTLPKDDDDNINYCEENYFGHVHNWKVTPREGHQVHFG